MGLSRSRTAAPRGPVLVPRIPARRLLFLIPFCLLSLGLTAQNIWQPFGASTSWNSALNWSAGYVPLTGDYVRIPSGAPTDPIMDVTPNDLSRLEVQAGRTLYLNGRSLTVNGNIDGAGTVDDSSGNGRLWFTGDFTLGNYVGGNNSGFRLIGAGNTQNVTIGASMSFYILRVVKSGGTANFSGATITANQFNITTSTTTTVNVPNPLNAQTIAISGSTGSFNFTGLVNATTSLTTDTNAYNMSFTGGCDIRGSTVFSNTGTLTLGDAAGDVMLFRGGITATAPSSVTLNGSLRTSGGGISIGDPGTPLILGGTTSEIDATNSGGTATGATLSLGGTVDGTAANTQSLTLDSGSTGAMTLSGAVGGTTPLQNLTITNSVALTFSSSMNLSGVLSQSNAATGQTSFNGAVQVGSATLLGTTYSIANSFTSVGAVTITSSGLITKGATGTISLTGAGNAFTTNGSSGALDLGSNITTNGGDVAIGGNLTIAEAQSPTIQTSNGAVTVSGTTAGTAAGVAEGLTVNAGTGAVLFSGAVGSGGAQLLTTLALTNSGTLTFTNAANLTGALSQTNAATGQTSFNSTVQVGSAILRGTTYSITNSFSSVGAVTITSSGLITKSTTGTISLTGAGNAFTTNGTSGALDLGSNITTNGGDVAIGGNLTIAQGQGPTIQTANGNLTVSGGIDGTAAGAAESLILNAGTGTVLLSGLIGSGGAQLLSALTVTNSGQITFANGIDLAGALTQTNAATGHTAFNAPVQAGSATLRGTTFAIVNSFSSVGAVTITSSGGIQKQATGSISVTGAGNDFTTNGSSGSLSLANDITTNGGDVSIGGSLSIAEAVSSAIQTSGGAVTVTGSTDGTNLGAAETLAVTSGGGNVLFSGSVGSGAATMLATLTVNSGAGTIGFSSAVNLAGDLTVQSSTGAMTFSSTVGAAGTFNINSNMTTTVDFFGNVAAGDLVKFSGFVDMHNRTITTTHDFVVFGGGYHVDDDGVGQSGVTGLFSYLNAGRTTNDGAGILADPHVAALAFPTPPVGATPANGRFANLGNVTVGGNFYVNGADMGGAGWTLALAANNLASDSFAEIYYCTISNANVTGGWLSAAESATAAGCSGNIDAARKSLMAGTGPTAGTATIYDNLIRVQISSGAFENDRNEISRAAAQIGLSTGIGAFTAADTFTDETCATSTDGQGDLSVFYIRSATLTWNTDASGAGAGNAASTDRDGNNQTVTPYLRIYKATAALYQVLRDSHKNRLTNYGTTPFTGVRDACRPVLVSIQTGQANHVHADNPADYDGHNFLQLRYSEPVTIGDLTMASAGVTGQDAFAAGQHGGEINPSGPSVSLAGYLSFAGTVSKGSRDGTSQVNSLYRAAPNSAGSLGLYISIGGRSSAPGAYRFWPGYFTSLTDPTGLAPSVPYNANITDLNGCPLEPSNDNAAPSGYANNYAKTVSAIAGSGWDSTRPQIRSVPGIYDVVPYTTTYQIETIEFRMTEDIRDSSFGLSAAPTFPTIPTNAFVLADKDGSPLAYRSLGNAFSTNVSSLYLGSHTAISDDTFSIALAPLYPDWTTKTQFYFQYDSSIGRITDSAGNLLQDYAGNNNCVEAVPPKIRLTSAAVGGTRLYLQFSEPVYHDGNSDGISDNSLQPGDFLLPGTGLTVTAVQELSWGAPTQPTPYTPALEAMLTLSGPLTADDILNFRMSGQRIMDRFTNPIITTVTHRISDYGLGIIDALSASDGVHAGDNENIGARSLGALRTFDGTGRLYDRNITVNSRMEASLPASLPVEMYFDVAPPASSLLSPAVTMADGSKASLPLWIPGSNSDLFDAPNSQARLASALSSSGSARSFLIPSGDAEVVSGSQVEFLYRVSDLYCLRCPDVNDPRRMDLFRIGIQDISMQRGGVTILNNVIDPTRGEHTAIQVDMTKSGNLTVQVFTLDGDVVRILSRTPSAAGTFYFTWDGRNGAGNAVARGLYFIRVVGPGIDEIRKVMIVKPR